MNEQDFDNAIDVEEMEKTAGWKLVSESLREAIETAEAELGAIDIKDKRPEDVGAKYIALVEGISGMERVFEIISDIKSRKQK